MAGKGGKMGGSKTRTGKTPMPKKGMVGKAAKAAKAAPAKKAAPAPMPKGAGPTGGFGGGVTRGGTYGS